MLLSLRRASSIAFCLGLALAHAATAQEFNAYVNTARTLPDPAVRASNRTTFAPELGGWNVYTGQLHSHTRGHDSPSAVLSWPRAQEMAWAYGYDFFSRNNHSTSWSDYDAARPFVEFANAAAGGLVVINGQENYYDGGNHPPGSHDHPNHYNTINGWPKQKDGDLDEFYGKIVPGYRSDPQQSIHVQLNHVAPATAEYTRLPADQPRRNTLRRIVDTVELNYVNDDTAGQTESLRSYMTLLRNGWRVSPTAQYDVHAERHDNDTWSARNADGSFVRPWVHYPGQPYEVVQHANGESGFSPHGRTGMVMPAASGWSPSTFLDGLNQRRTFRTTMDRSVGMYAVGGQVMGNEFSLGDNRAPIAFKVWGKSFPQQHDGTIEPFMRAELWSPSRPDAPIKTVDLHGTTDFGAELFSVTPYESIYFVRLTGLWSDHDIVMAPVWIANPAQKLDSAVFLFPTPSGNQLLLWSGGGRRVQIQRARVHAPHFPKNWETVAEVDNIGRFAYDVSNESVYTYWRVVDPTESSVMTNEVLFTRPNQAPLGSFDAIDVANGRIRGWSFDPDHPSSPLTVHVYSGGTFILSGTTGVSRPDVQQVYGAGANSGFDIEIPSGLRNGTRSFSVYALDLDAEPNPLLSGSPRTATFTINGGGGVDDPDPLCESKPWMPQCNP